MSLMIIFTVLVFAFGAAWHGYDHEDDI